MDWPTGYLGCFILGTTFVALTALVGQFGGDSDGDAAADGGAHDMADGVAGVHLPLFSPMVLAVFVGMFGVGGLLLMRGLGLLNPWLHVPGAAAVSLTSGVSVAWAMMRLMRAGESNSIGSHAALVGRTVEVTLSIKGPEFGEIAYQDSGFRQTMVAKSLDGRDFPQGTPVQVLQVVEGTAYVGPVGSLAPIQPVTSVSTGIPVERISDRSK